MRVSESDLDARELYCVCSISIVSVSFYEVSRIRSKVAFYNVSAWMRDFWKTLENTSVHFPSKNRVFKCIQITVDVASDWRLGVGQ